jgi:zinc protease
MSAASLVAQRPEPAPPRPWQFPSFERRQVAAGRIIACHLPDKPLAVMSLVLEAGAVAEPAGREGVALLLAHALSEGTTSRDAYGFAVAGERLGASWRADTDWDSLRCGFEVPVGELAAAGELLAEAVRRPALDDATLERVRDERLDEMRLDLSQPGPRAAEAFVDAIFDPASRYAIRDGGNARSVASISNDDIRAFHRDRFGPASATLVIAGDLSTADLDAIGRSVFDGWAVATTTPAPPLVRPRGGGGRVIVVDRPGSVQSMLYAGHDGPPRSIDDYVPMTTMALALGGMFNSRLNFRLREDKGYTYGAFGGFECRRHGGVFVARAAVHTEATAPALTDLLHEIRLMHDDGLDEAELDLARRYRAGIFPVSFAGPGAVAGGLADLVVHGFGDDHFDRLRAAIEAVTAEEVNAAAATRLRPDDMVAVVVGDASLIEQPLRDAGLGSVEVVTDED